MTDRASSLPQQLAHYLQRVNDPAAARVQAALDDFDSEPSRAAFFRLFALAPRWTGRQAARRNAAELAAMGSLHGNLVAGCWDDDQLARLWILASVQQILPAEQFARELDTLFNTGDTGELVALYRSLAMLSEPGQFHDRAREGARSNMVTIFLAVAHNNSYPRDFFDQAGWNQLVLKAIFNACPLDPVVGLDERNNAALSHMLSDYVRERWAAGRSVPWDIWRCIGPHADQGDDLALLGTALRSPERLTRFAAALALRDCGTPAAGELLRAETTTLNATDGKSWQDLVALDQGG